MHTHTHLEDESAVRRDDRRVTASSVGVVGRADQTSLLSDRELRDTLIPTLDDLSDANLGTERVVAIAGRVEFISVRLQSADVVDRDRVTLLGLRASTV